MIDISIQKSELGRGRTMKKKIYLILLIFLLIVIGLIFSNAFFYPFILIIAGVFQIILVRVDKPSKKTDSSFRNVIDAFDRFEGIALIILGVLWLLIII